MRVTDTLESATESFNPTVASKSTSGRFELVPALKPIDDHAGDLRNVQRCKTSIAKQKDYFATCASDDTHSGVARQSATRNDPKDVSASEVKLQNDAAIMHGLHECGLIPDDEMIKPIWLCIICDQSFSSKGVCKRHIEQQHETREKHQCVGCLTELPNAKKAKRHCKTCSHGAQGFRPAPTKVVHGCEYCGVTCSSQDSYVEHLVDHSFRIPAKKSKHRHLQKLRGLLKQPAVSGRLHDLSFVILGSETGWRDLGWDERHVQQAIQVLEQGTVLVEGKERIGHSSLDMDAFLGQLLRLGYLDTSTQRGTLTAKPSPVQQRESSVGRSHGGWTSTLGPVSRLSPGQIEASYAATTYKPDRRHNVKPVCHDDSAETNYHYYLEKSPPVQKPGASATKRPISHFSNLSQPHRTPHNFRTNDLTAASDCLDMESPPPYHKLQEGGRESIAHQPAIIEALPYAEHWTTGIDNSSFSLRQRQPHGKPATMPAPPDVSWYMPDSAASDLAALSHNQAASYSSQAYNLPPQTESSNGETLGLANNLDNGELGAFDGSGFDLPLDFLASESPQELTLQGSIPSEQDNLWTFWRD